VTTLVNFYCFWLRRVTMCRVCRVVSGVGVLGNGLRQVCRVASGVVSGNGVSGCVLSNGLRQEFWDSLGISGCVRAPGWVKLHFRWTVQTLEAQLSSGRQDFRRLEE